MLYESRSVRRVKQKNQENRRLLAITILAASIVTLLTVLLWSPINEALVQLFPQPETSLTAAPLPSEAVSEEATQAGSEESSEAAMADTPARPVRIDETAAVGADYFADALFIGDSLTYGLDGYNIIPEAAFVCSVGINLNTIDSEMAASFDLAGGGQGTMVEAIAQQTPPGKVYIMMGTNGINWLSKDGMLARYRELVGLVRSLFPEALVYIQNLPPATYTAGLNQPGLSRESIAEFNQGLLALAEEMGVFYLDVHSCLGDEQGHLPEAVAGADGIHFSVSHYQTWYEYLRTHTYQPQP